MLKNNRCEGVNVRKLENFLLLMNIIYLNSNHYDFHCI